jgi:hypothetical protein
MGKRFDAAMAIRPLYQQGAQSFADTDALKVKGIYEQWEKLVEQGFKTDKVGYIFAHGKDLYRTEQPVYTFVAHYEPGTVGTESLFSHIDEEHKGTIDDPIPYSGNMALENGKYYEQDGVVYICTRDTVNPVYSALKDLVGLYVEVASNG